MLEVTRLVAGYGRVPVLAGISLRVGAGEIITLIGANGAGKSTTLRAISGLLAVRSGEITFKGERMSGLRPHEIVRRGVVHVPEGRRLFGDMTVRENLVLGAYTRPRADIDEQLDTVFRLFPRLRERATQLARSLSGGEQQMVAIGRGLMARPSLLMLDEPSLGLAPRLVAQVAAMIRSIRDLGITVLLVEQNARMSLDLADRAYLLQTGRVIVEGPSARLREDPAVQRAYLGRAPTPASTSTAGGSGCSLK